MGRIDGRDALPAQSFSYPGTLSPGDRPIARTLGHSFSNAFARINRPILFAYEPVLQPNADFLKAKLGDKVRLERFDEDGHALFVDDPVRFNRLVEQFVQSWPKQ